MIDPPIYLHLTPGVLLPDIAVLAPFRAVVIVNATVTPDWQRQISEWLVASGCRYMMAWGHDCSSWDDSVDYASLERFDYGDVPEDESVMTTWHPDEPLTEVFAYCHNLAFHVTVEHRCTLLLHIAEQGDARLADVYEASAIWPELSS